MEELIITLEYKPEYFKEIYYKNGQGNILTYKLTRDAIAYFLLVAVITFIIYLFSFKNPGLSWTIVLGCIFSFFLGVYAVYIIRKYLAWKRPVINFMKELAQYNSQYVTLTPGAIVLTQDTKVSIDKWDNIRSAEIQDTFVSLKTHELAYIFPAKSMQPDEYIKLKDFIVSKIKTAQTTPL